MAKVEHIKYATPFIFRSVAKEMAGAIISICTICKSKSVTLQFRNGLCEVLALTEKRTVNGNLEGTGFLQLKKSAICKLMRTFSSSEDEMTITESMISSGGATILLQPYLFLK